MKIRSQIGMVLNLDKCIGCHTCSITCKKTSGPAAKAWNTPGSTTSNRNPGSATRKNGKNQDKWKGGWIRNANGTINPRIGGKFRVLANIFLPTRICRASTITTSPSTSITSTCTPRRWASISPLHVRVR